MTSIVWFRQDLRVSDNPALDAAIAAGGAVIPVYIWSPDEENGWTLGGASRCWLHHALAQLQKELEQLALPLILRIGNSQETLSGLILETKATHLFWNRRYEPYAIQRDTKIKAACEISVRSFNSALLFEPWTIANKKGKPFKIFTPFWRTCLTEKEPAKPTPRPRGPFKTMQLPSLSLNELKLSKKFEAWQPECAEQVLERFLAGPIVHYAEGRDRPDLAGVSRLSPYLHFGQISPRQIWHSVKKPAGDAFLRQLGWREFAHHLLYHFPETVQKPLYAKFAAFPWLYDEKALQAWQKGQTGYPIVDAGMRELWQTGWMHNRVRMIVGSFLVKDLLLPWQEGARWFWDTLVDADLANNTLGWQWIAGCGADAAPYFRIFNPVLQGEKFDPQGAYVRKWVPELQKLPQIWLQQPWNAPDAALKEAGIVLGDSYPKPIVDHEQARKRALAALQTVKETDV